MHMVDAVVVWELILRGVAIGALAAIAAGLWRSGRAAIRGAALMLTISAAAHLLNSHPLTRMAMGDGLTAIPVHFLALGGAGWFWMFIVTLFEDRPISPVSFGPGVLLTIVGLAGWIGRQEMNSPVWIIHNLIEAAFAL